MPSAIASEAKAPRDEGPWPGPALETLGRELRALGYRFITPTPATQARVNARPHNAWARGVADVFGWSRPFKSGMLESSLFERAREADVLVAEGDGAWRATLRASTLGDALFFHSAHPTTAADAVFFGPDTYRFDAAIRDHLRRGGAVRRALDIGCGAGPGAVRIALERPGAEVIGIDINDTALRLTTVNARLAGAAGLTARHSDLYDRVEGLFDLIVANPPYLLDSRERAYRHGGGSLGEGLSLAIAREAAAHLAPGGTLLLYTGSAIVDGEDRLRACLARELMPELDWHYREVDPDVFGEELLEPAYAEADRIAAVVLTARRRE